MDSVRKPSTVMVDYGRLLSANAAIKRQLRTLMSPAERVRLEGVMAANRGEMSHLMKRRHAELRSPRGAGSRRGAREEEE